MNRDAETSDCTAVRRSRRYSNGRAVLTCNVVGGLAALLASSAFATAIALSVDGS